MIKIRYAFLLTLVLSLLPASLAAQEGRYVILSAQYGHERNHVDVTDRLRELARSGQPFQVNNRNFRVDPDPGVRKVLRIYARGPEGGERMFEYVENSVVDGAMFRGWRTGEWGRGGWSGSWAGGGGPVQGQYVVLSAQYGHERNHVDVTGRLRELARSGQPFQVTNRTFGVDPDPGVRKVLRIYARGPEGGERMFEYVENSVVDGSMFKGWRTGEWGRGGWSGKW
jgi:2'-5' RNA ligase